MANDSPPRSGSGGTDAFDAVAGFDRCAKFIYGNGKRVVHAHPISKNSSTAEQCMISLRSTRTPSACAFRRYVHTVLGYRMQRVVIRRLRVRITFEYPFFADDRTQVTRSRGHLSHGRTNSEQFIQGTGHFTYPRNDVVPMHQIAAAHHPIPTGTFK